MNKKKWIGWTVAAVIFTNALTFIGLTTYPVLLPSGKVIINREDFSRLEQFYDLLVVNEIIHERYVGEIDNAKLQEGAIKGMTSALEDPYTVYMNKDEYREWNEHSEGNYSGVGLSVQSKENKIKIIDVFEGSPAEKGGIMPGDEIQKVNGTDVDGSTLDKAVTMMKGEQGTEVTITFYREEKGSFDVKLKRAKVNIPMAKSEMLSNGIGYLQLYSFDEDSAKTFKKELNNLKAQGMKGLVVDLRDNLGGYLDQCVDIASNFLPKGEVIVSTMDKYENKKEYKSKGGDYIGLPLVVLTNENSASASEIFAGAIRDYNVGTLIGEKTYGKGLVQTIFETGEGTALKVTISKYYTPKGEDINKKGIVPNVEVKYPEELKKKPYNRENDPQFKKALEVVEEKIREGK
ncbi:S41 family peptidase [Clostridium sp. MSJ-11]|uniref:S41 family peptidase n=1 Tax=Clostridium mobile TaxID=2841512 RepID=A0ABS6EIU9_9CLOT|nr:S41 family peptidase [Clostridium mobile]MBU5485159.1 S41 family peptidase [Clostridium mobile]